MFAATDGYCYKTVVYIGVAPHRPTCWDRAYIDINPSKDLVGQFKNVTSENVYSKYLTKIVLVETYLFIWTTVVSINWKIDLIDSHSRGFMSYFLQTLIETACNDLMQCNKKTNFSTGIWSGWVSAGQLFSTHWK